MKLKCMSYQFGKMESWKIIIITNSIPVVNSRKGIFQNGWHTCHIFTFCYYYSQINVTHCHNFKLLISLNCVARKYFYLFETQFGDLILLLNSNVGNCKIDNRLLNPKFLLIESWKWITIWAFIDFVSNWRYLSEWNLYETTQLIVWNLVTYGIVISYIALSMIVTLALKN